MVQVPRQIPGKGRRKSISPWGEGFSKSKSKIKERSYLLQQSAVVKVDALIPVSSAFRRSIPPCGISGLGWRRNWVVHPRVQDSAEVGAIGVGTIGFRGIGPADASTGAGSSPLIPSGWTPLGGFRRSTRGYLCTQNTFWFQGSRPDVGTISQKCAAVPSRARI